MNYILQRRQSPSFAISEDVLLAVHFMICQSDLTTGLTTGAGLYRTGWVGVRDSRTGEIMYEGVDRDELGPRIGELLEYVNEETVESVFLQAACHLQFASGHQGEYSVQPSHRISFAPCLIVDCEDSI